ncbi:lipase/esterase LipG [soil metagenome]
MPYALNGTARIYYEVMGKPTSPAILLVNGFSAQLIGWQDAFCRLVADCGFSVIRFDNRDVGLSQQFDSENGFDPRYSIQDMAGDGFAVMDDLGVDRFHLVGQSMGGMIAQSMAGAHPDRVSSLTLVFTAPFITADWLPPLASVSDMRFEPLNRSAFIEAILEQERLNASDVYPFGEDWIRTFAGDSYDRGYFPRGMERQLHAMLSRLGEPFTDHGRLAMPVVLIHGREDIRVRVDASIELARLIPHSEVHLYPSMGHVLPETLWTEFADIIARTAHQAGGQRG